MANSIAAFAAWLASCAALLLHSVAAALHSFFVLPVVSWWETGLEQAEESTKAFIREAFGLIASALNDAGSWVLSAVDTSYGENQQRASRQQAAWQSWWREDRTSTLNAVVANAQQRGGARGVHACAHGAAAWRGVLMVASSCWLQPTAVNAQHQARVFDCRAASLPPHHSSTHPNISYTCRHKTQRAPA
jgi:hypothetical protein